MSYKQLLFKAEAREKVLRGASALADAVRVTLGPKSKCVLIAKKWGTPIVCDDGVTILDRGADDSGFWGRQPEGIAEVGGALHGTASLWPPVKTSSTLFW